MRRQCLTALGAFVAIALATGCHGNDGTNMITNPGPTATPMPGAPAPTPAPGGQTATVEVGQSGNAFVDSQSGSATTTIHVGDTVRWVWVSGIHSTTSGTCAGGCQPDGLWDSGAGSGMTFSRTFSQSGSFPYFCLVHGSMMMGNVVVR